MGTVSKLLELVGVEGAGAVLAAATELLSRGAEPATETGFHAAAHASKEVTTEGATTSHLIERLFVKSEASAHAEALRAALGVATKAPAEARAHAASNAVVLLRLLVGKTVVVVLVKTARDVGEVDLLVVVIAAGLGIAVVACTGSAGGRGSSRSRSGAGGRSSSSGRSGRRSGVIRCLDEKSRIILKLALELRRKTLLLSTTILSHAQEKGNSH